MESLINQILKNFPTAGNGYAGEMDAPVTNRLTFKILHKMADGIFHHFWPHQNVERKDIETKRDKQHFFLDASQESQVQTYRQLYVGLLPNSQHHIVMRSH